jgi:TP901 family phage tail tape measure protein
MGMREWLLVIQARDQASQAIQGVGNAVGAVGTQSRFAGYQVFALGLALQKAGGMLTRFGMAIFDAVGDTARLGIEFDKSMSLVQTQARLGETQLRKFQEAANDVMGDVAVSSTEVAEGLFDIFSSVEVNYKDAISMVELFSKAATAGGTDVRTTTRGVIQIMNAFGLEADDTRNILDLLFKQVQQSTGTFEELISAWGNVVSAAKSMDQSLQTTAGAVDFLTKRGRTQAQATISVSRALDQLSRHYQDVQKVLGVQTFDKATGNFRQLGDIITDMGLAMKDMTTQEQVDAFEDMFGAGSIQANRFFRLAVPQFKALTHNIDALTRKDLVGYFKGAWDIMRKTPAVQIEILRNKWDSLRRDLRNLFLPVILDLVKVGKRVLDWIDGWDQGTKELIVKILLAVGALAVFFGAIAKIGGGILLFASLLKFAGIGVLGFIKILGGLGLAGGLIAAALIGAAILIFTHWDELKDWWIRNWGTIKHVALLAIAALTVALVTLGRTLAINVGARLINLVVSFQTVGTAALTFKGIMSGLGMVLRRLGWVALALGILEVVNAFREGREKGQAFFQMLKTGSEQAITKATERFNTLNNRLQELSFWDRLKFWEFPEYARWKGEMQGIEDAFDRNAEHLDRQRQNLFDWADGIAEGDDRLRTFGQTLIWNTGLNRKQTEVLMREARGVELLRGHVSDLTLKQVLNLAAVGDLNGAIKILNRLQGEHLGVLRNLATPEQAAAERAEDMAQKVRAHVLAQKALNRSLNETLGPLKNLISPANAYAEQASLMAQKLAAAAGAQRAFNEAVNAAPVGGGHGRHIPKRGGGGGGSNTGGGNPGPSPDRPNINVTVTPNKANIDNKDLMREVDWVIRSAQWM